VGQAIVLVAWKLRNCHTKIHRHEYQCHNCMNSTVSVWHSAASPQLGLHVILGGADHRFSWSARKNDRRQKAIVCPTRNLRSAQRNEDLVAQAFLPVLDLIFSQFPVPGKIVEARICEVDQARSAFLPNNE
jgi:hypothetical protein